MNTKKNILAGIVIFLFIIHAQAQQPVISVTLDSTQLMIGGQTLLHLEIAANKAAQLQLPYTQDTLMQGVEVLNISKPDTTDLGNSRIKIKYDYLITSFDSALYLLPPFKLIADNDTFYSNELALKVSTVPVDTESGKFFDIKNVMLPRWVLADYVNIFFYILGVCFFILAIIYIIFRKKKQKPLFSFAKEEKTILPPHVRALHALDEIKAKKLWQKGNEKEYHSQLTDVIRKYIEERFCVHAMEMTSDQILQKTRGISDIDFVFDNLKQMLLLADWVKFAKYRSLPDENELSMMNAYLFVNNTMPVLATISDEEKENNEENIKKENKE
jgi:hypothetical protein